MRLIRPEIRGDTFSWGADLRKSSFSHLLNGPSIFSLCLFFPAPEHRIGSPALRPVVYSATPVAGMTDRKPGYFLSNISESYTIWQTKRVRKSIFLQKRTPRSGRDILIKFSVRIAPWKPCFACENRPNERFRTFFLVNQAEFPAQFFVGQVGHSVMFAGCVLNVQFFSVYFFVILMLTSFLCVLLAKQGNKVAAAQGNLQDRGAGCCQSDVKQ